MSLPRPPDELFGLLSLESLSQVNVACEQFESEWKSGGSPAAEMFLNSGDVVVKELLLYELLAIESEYRGRADFCEESCVRRFPDFGEAIRGWFAAGHLSQPAGDNSAADGATLPLPRGNHASVSEEAGQSPRGRFRALRPHASGGLGEIWLARDEELGRDVALKRIKSPLADDPQCRARFLREAETTGRLEHPGIVPVYGLGRDRQGRPFYAMRLIGGENLHDAIVRWHQDGAQPGVGFRKLLRHFLDVCNVVEFAHRRGVIHRDLKPRNVMLGEFGETVVVDWGLARHTGEGVASESSAQSVPAVTDGALTQADSVFGTLAYMSPEQARGRLDQVGPPSDVFALGAMLYGVLAGQAPYVSDNDAGLLEQACRCEFTRPRPKTGRVPAALESICRKAMSREASDRYRSARELADDVERWLADEAVHAHRDAWPARLSRWSRRHKTLVATSTVAAALLIASLAAIIALQDRAKERLVERNQVIQRQRDESYTLIERQQIATAARAINEPEAARDALRLVPPSRRGWDWRRLGHDLHLGAKPVASLTAHDWGVLDLLWDEKTSTLITAGHDGRLLAAQGENRPSVELAAGSWSQERLAWRHALFGFSGEPSDLQADDCITRLAWLEPGKEFVGVSLRGKVSAWSLPVVTEGASRRDLAVHDRALFAVAARQNQILCGDDKGSMLLLPPSAAGCATRRKPLASDAAILDLTSLPERRWAVAQQDGAVSVLDETAARVVATRSAEGPAWCLDVSPDGAMLAVGGGRGQIDCYRIDDPSKGLERQESYRPPNDLNAAVAAIYIVRFSPDGQWLAGGDSRGRLLVWDRASGKLAIIGETQRVLSEDVAETLPWPFRRRLAAIEFAAAGDHCLIAGHDPVVRRWQVRGRRGISEWQLGPAARARFDPVTPHLLWAGTGDGRLSIWHSRDRRRLDSTRAHEGPITAVEVTTLPLAANTGSEGNSPSTSMAATCGPDGDIRLWTLHGEELRALPKAIRHNRMVVDVALSPDGRHLAAYDAAWQITLWDLATTRCRATRQLGQAENPPPKARLAFSADGKRLALFAPDGNAWILSAANLDIVEKPNMTAGQGGTALVWHSRDAETLFTGDTLGRIVRHPQGDWARLHVEPLKSAVVGIGWSPHGDGGRLAIAWRNGAIRVVDPKWAGGLLTLQSPRSAAGQSSPADLMFDPLGNRLALVHDDGAIEIWETPSDPRWSPPLGAARRWGRTLLLEGAAFAGLEVRRQAVALDDAGRLMLLFTALDENQELTAPEADGRTVFFAREGPSAVNVEVIPGRAVPRSLALHANGGELLATLRRPLPEAGGVLGAFLLLRSPLKTGNGKMRWSEEDLTARPNNEGFDVELLTPSGGLPEIVHFCHSGLYLLATWHDGSQWRTTRLGRQGDGLRHLTAASPDGRSWYSIFWPSGLNGQLQTLTCLVTQWKPLVGNSVARRSPPGLREVCDTSFGGYRRSIAVDGSGKPVLLYSRVAEDPNQSLLLARRTDAGWKSSTVLPFNPKLVSNLRLAGGALTFAYLGADGRTLCLATRDADDWKSERIGQLPEPEIAEEADLQRWELVLVHAPGDRPIVVVAASGSRSGALWSFRLDD
jgi:serine/threonine protein kinase/WD40 repeat protein